jgi:flagellar hook-basal body complex protein FliE
MAIDGMSSIQSLREVGGIVSAAKAKEASEANNNAAFEALFQSALSLVNETDELTNKAEEEEIKYAIGQSDNTHDLQVAQQKANLSLQYTVAVRSAVIDAYKEIMNLQF